MIRSTSGLWLSLVTSTVVLASGAPAAAATPDPRPGNCPLEKAVYLAEGRLKDTSVAPDELRFDFKGEPAGQPPPEGWPRNVLIKSAQMGVTLKFGFWLQNNTGTEFASAELPPAQFSPQMKAAYKARQTKSEPFKASSPIFSTDEDFQVRQIPHNGVKTPVIVMFPDFLSFSHSSYNGLVSAGLAWGVFKFARCES
ncbi:hypothetical protein [Microvirga arsenatis]|uniref:Uncharacterized protein n=1 Tax=Microvirga arsenatis TaxID=2692265 RepID=A0ABW9Z3R0_9HYPH|nr:hypothetical protein [Microvirga arsenatis]NBJ13685.1 hypothetical protein [Microvirga arsenatis]NBJ27165.1 hypothetical protein [Microvirga arsenatis]